LQPIKGIIIFHSCDELPDKAEVLLKTLSCQVLSTVGNRYTIKTSRGNLQAIKQRWQANKPDNSTTHELSDLVCQIIIGGAA
jgi:hypothetical protein